jgi:hypothetical protein
MNAVVTLAIAALDFLEKIMPSITSLKISGQITTEEQSQLHAKLNNLRSQIDSQFSGPEWEVTED